MGKWKLNLSWSLGLFVTLSLILIFPATVVSSKKFNGTFTTEAIRELWQACSMAHQSMNTPQHIYLKLCDCAVDVMRVNYDNVITLQKMSPEESKQLAVLVRLTCNEWRRGEN